MLEVSPFEIPLHVTPQFRNPTPHKRHQIGRIFSILPFFMIWSLFSLIFPSSNLATAEREGLRQQIYREARGLMGATSFGAPSRYYSWLQNHICSTKWWKFTGHGGEHFQSLNRTKKPSERDTLRDRNYSV